MAQPGRACRPTIFEAETGRALRYTCRAYNSPWTEIPARTITRQRETEREVYVLLQVVLAESLPKRQRSVLFLAASIQSRLPFRLLKIRFTVSLAGWHQDTKTGRSRPSSNCRGDAAEANRSGKARTVQQHLQQTDHDACGWPQAAWLTTIPTADIDLRVEVLGMVARIRFCETALSKSSGGSRTSSTHNSWTAWFGSQEDLQGRRKVCSGQGWSRNLEAVTPNLINHSTSDLYGPSTNRRNIRTMSHPWRRDC